MSEISDISDAFSAYLTAIARHVDSLSELANQSTSRTLEKAQGQVDEVDAEIARLKQLIKTCDELEDEFVKIRHIGEFAEDFKRRLRQVEASLE